MKGWTIDTAAHSWVSELNAFPQGMIETLMNADPDSWREVTTPTPGDTVYLYDENCSGEIIERDGQYYHIELNDKTHVTHTPEEKFEVERDDVLPMWGTLWAFSDSADKYWLEDMDGIRIMSECGFRVYEHDEWGYFFGIDGAGYSFYEAHWIPLYKARGLKWHDEAAEHEYQMYRNGYKKGWLGRVHAWLDKDGNFIEEVGGECDECQDITS